MKEKSLKGIKSLTLIMLCLVFLAQILYQPGNMAEAAAKKPSITKSMTIPIGKVDSKTYWNKNSYELTKAEKLTVKNKVKGASYTFKSSNTKIVTIGNDGGFLTGVKAGSATITCTQTLKNKKTTVGTCKVTVKKATMKLNEYAESEFPVGKNEYGLYDYYADMESIYHIEYRNPKATYSLTSDSKNFTIKEVKHDASSAKKVTKDSAFIEELEGFMGDRYFYGYEFTAKKAGTYKVTAKETYNKKTTTLGSFKVVVKNPSLAETDIDLLLGDSVDVNYLVKYPKADTAYYFSIDDFDSENNDNNVLTVHEDIYANYLYGNKVGSAKVTVRENSDKGELIGTINFVVSEAPCKEIIVTETEYTTYEGEDYFGIYYKPDPWNTTDKVTITSDNPDVLKVTYDEEYYGGYSYQVGKAGKAIVTISCGEISIECVVTVLTEDEYYSDDDLDW